MARSIEHPGPPRPTNTGKTHRAIERMLEHDTGMIGLPLRLLAREVYDRSHRASARGASRSSPARRSASPKRPDYWVCTVEAMPVSREVDFLAVDEVQLAAHPQRGHVFTDRSSTRAGRARRGSSAPTRCAGSWSSCPRRRSPSAPAPLAAQRAGPSPSRASRRAAPSWPSPWSRSTSSPSACMLRRRAAPPWCSARSRRARATRRWRCSRRARSTTSSPPTPSGWGSTSTCATWPSRRCASSTGARRAPSTSPSSPRSPAARGATSATAPSAPSPR
jgi:hypothetical protein